jgi:hypothetical protein
MPRWKNEDDLNAELRELTSELRRLREELRGMVEPGEPTPTRAFLHRQSWPAQTSTAAVDDRPRSQRRRKK